MQEIVLTLPFNREYFLANQKSAWSLSVKSVSTGYIIYGILTALVLIGGIAVDSKGGLPLISLLGLVMLVSICLKLRNLYLVRKKFFAKANYIAHKYTEEQIVHTYTFSDFGLAYEDKERYTKLSWPLFDSVISWHDKLILKLVEDGQIYLMLSREEVGEDTYNQIYDTLTQKTGVYEVEV